MTHEGYRGMRFKCGDYYGNLTKAGKCSECGKRIEIVIREVPE